MTLNINSFPSASNLPLWVGQRQGFFHRHGVEVALSHPHGSVEQMAGLKAGRYEIVMTAFDNVAAYRDGQGAETVGPLDLVAFMGGDGGFLTLVAAPGTRDIAALKGRVMAVDALSTGFSFALQAVLAKNGVAADAVRYVAVGSSGARWKALEEGKADAALLTMPVDLEAADKGYVALTTVTASLGHYAGLVAAARQDWLAANRSSVVAFLSGYRDAVQWLVAPGNKPQAITILHAEMPRIEPSLLERIYALLVDPRAGVSRDLALDPAGAETVLALRARYAKPARPEQDWRRYVDTSYLAAARP